MLTFTPHPSHFTPHPSRFTPYAQIVRGYNEEDP